MQEFTIESHKIGPNYPPFIVAEISGNHNHSMERALQIVDAAKAAGVNAVKLQTYTADTMTLDINDKDFVINDPKSLWHNRSLYNLYKENAMPWEWHQPIFQRCRELGLIPFSTPFDSSAVEFLETLNVPCYKIASLEITDHPLIRQIAATGKPLIISTGGATLEEIGEAVAVARSEGCHQLILLKCTSAYPALPESINLRTLPHLSESFETLVGLSDHTLGIGVAIASIAMGACLIEKHFTLARSDGGDDATFSLEPQEMKCLVSESLNAWKALGTVHYGPTESERTYVNLRRSLYFVKDLPAATKITSEDIKAIRPGYGLQPKEYERVIGLPIKHAVKRGDAVKWDLFASMDK